MVHIMKENIIITVNLMALEYIYLIKIVYILENLKMINIMEKDY